MAKKIMHLLFTGEHASPFDVNMAADAGYDVLIPYTSVDTSQVTALVQDCIYSRPPGSAADSGLFIGGRDVNQAADMLEAARSAMVQPFEVSVMGDPNGAYTTAGALVALAQRHLAAADKALADSRVVIFGGGPVGMCAAVLAHRCGAHPVIARLTPGSISKQASMDEFMARYDASVEFVGAEDLSDRQTILASADVVVSTAKAGIEVLGATMIKDACKATVALDVNAVPPAGIAGVGVMDNGVASEFAPDCLGVGALAIGNIKYKTQQRLLNRMLESESALILDFFDAFDMANELVAK